MCVTCLCPEEWLVFPEKESFSGLAPSTAGAFTGGEIRYSPYVVAAGNLRVSVAGVESYLYSMCVGRFWFGCSHHPRDLPLTRICQAEPTCCITPYPCSLLSTSPLRSCLRSTLVTPTAHSSDENKRDRNPGLDCRLHIVVGNTAVPHNTLGRDFRVSGGELCFSANLSYSGSLFTTESCATRRHTANQKNPSYVAAKVPAPAELYLWCLFLSPR